MLPIVRWQDLKTRISALKITLKTFLYYLKFHSFFGHLLRIKKRQFGVLF
jgi:hypothetical protein